MNANDYHNIERRSAFWRENSRNLEQAFREIRCRNADKWVNEADKVALTGCEKLVKFALSLSLNRQKDVILAQIDALNDDEDVEGGEAFEQVCPTT